MPPDIELELTSVPIDLKKGSEYEFKITRFGLSYAFTVNIEACEPGQLIVERAQFSFFEEWVNTTRFEEHSESSTLLTNIIDYQLPLGILGTLADDLFVRKDLLRILQFSHRKLKSFFT
jgi:ligand-binding SRPBCC domain-containing protein